MTYGKVSTYLVNLDDYLPTCSFDFILSTYEQRVMSIN